MANPIEEIEARVEAWYDDERNQIPESAEQFAADIGTLLEFINRQREEIERLQSDKAAYREQFEELASQLERLQEQEASICPEDVGFVEYIDSLERRVERLKAEQLTPTMARKVVAVLEDPQVFRALRPLETGTLAALRLRSLSGGTTDV